MLIYIYKTPTNKIIIPQDMNISDVMSALLIEQSGWRVGHFKNICNIPIKEEEKNVDYGFKSTAHGGWIDKEQVEKYSHNHKITYLDDGRVIASAYVNAYNEILDHKPKILNDYGLSLYKSISWEISKYLHSNPDIKRKYGLE